ncbi:MAG: RodZ domain-containing protein [Syntrophaceae bacterium]
MTINSETQEKHSEVINVMESDLKAIRESQGISLKDIFERTRISAVNLEAIESGKFELLPSPVITKSFIKLYAKALGVDSSNILARYENYLETLKTPHQEEEVEKTVPSFSRRYRRVLLWILFILITAGIIIFLLSSYNSNIETMKNQTSEAIPITSGSNPADTLKTDVKNDSADQTVPSSHINDKEPSPAPLISQTQTASHQVKEKRKTEPNAAVPVIISQQKEIAETYEITIEARELTWLRMATDQKSPREILMKPGEKIKKSASYFTIDIGNAGGIDISFQGKSLGSLGKQGQVVHLRLP